jgi:RimJ/RimL family protein N-acetyltransferase
VIELVPTSPDYAELWKSWREEPSALLHNPLSDLDVEMLRERMRQSSSDFSEIGTAAEFQFFVKFEQNLVGAVGLFGLNSKMKYGELGYSIGQDFQGRGLATMAVHRLAEKIFAETDLRRLIAHVAEGNIASRRVLAKVGFKEEGLLREHFLIRGKPTNEVAFGLLRSEFKIQHRERL